MIEWATARYGLPYRGYDGVRTRSDVPRDMLATGSFDLRYDPTQGRFLTRSGSAIHNDSLSPNPTGLLEAKFGAKARCIVEFESASLSDGYPTYGCVFTDEADKEGAFYFRSSNSTGYNHTLGDAYDTTNHYPATSRDLSAFEHKWLPMWSEHASAVQGRGTTAAQRRMVTAGTRRCMKVGRNMLFPNLQGTPLRWYDTRFNDTTSAGTEPERVGPWGLVPPLYLPRFIINDLASVRTSSVRSWKTNDRFYAAMTFVNEDGCESKPFVPSSPASLAIATGRYGIEYADGGGLVTVDTGDATNKYTPYLRLSKVPIGPPGTRERRLYRTPKVDAGTTGPLPDPSDLRLWEIIPDNTTETFDAYNGSDDGLLLLADDPANNRTGTAVLLGKVWPKRGRSMGAFDGRVMIGYLKDNPSAIVLCPTGPGDGSSSSNTRINNGSDEKLITTGHYMYRVYDNAGTKTLQLRYIAAATALPATPLSTAITLTSAKTLQDVVNEINATLTTTAGGGGEWAAAVAPGTNPQTTADNIDYTSGYAYGDDSASLLADGTTGNVRCWNNAWVGILYFTQSHMSSLPTYKDEFIHTEAGPLYVNIGQSGSPFNFVVNGPGWRRKPPEDAGFFVGMAPLPDGCVLFYSKSVWRYQNRRGGTTGEDFDYRPNKISDEGCISGDSIAWGNGWAGWLSRSGYRVTDGERGSEALISGALYDAETGAGDLGYEIGKCVDASAADSDGAWFSAKVIGSALYISFRSTGTYPNRMCEYSFAATAANSGLAQILTPDGQPFGWSLPWKIGYGTLGAYRSTGTGTAALRKLGAVEESTTSYGTGDGRIDRFDTGTADQAAAIVPVWYHRMDDFGGIGRRSRVKRMRWKHKTATGSVTTIGVSRDVARSSRRTYTLSSTGANPFGFGVKRLKLPQHAPSRVYETDGTNDGAGASAFELYGGELEYRLLDTPTT